MMMEGKWSISPACGPTYAHGAWLSHHHHYHSTYSSTRPATLSQFVSLHRFVAAGGRGRRLFIL